MGESPVSGDGNFQDLQKFSAKTRQSCETWDVGSVHLVCTTYERRKQILMLRNTTSQCKTVPPSFRSSPCLSPILSFLLFSFFEHAVKTKTLKFQHVSESTGEITKVQVIWLPQPRVSDLGCEQQRWRTGNSAELPSGPNCARLSLTLGELPGERIIICKILCWELNMFTDYFYLQY